MAQATSKPVVGQPRYRWRWIMVAVGFISWVSIGCSPASLSMMLMPFMDNNVDPEYKLFAKDKELTLVIQANFAQPPLHPDLVPAEIELAEKVASYLRKRCAENKHKLKIVSSAEVRAHQLNQRLEGTGGPIELGKKFKADYVLDLHIESLALYEKKAVTPLFRGEAEITVTLHKIDASEGEHKVFHKVYRGEGNPTPFDAGSMSAATFRGGFLTKMSGDISKMFISYPPQERAPFENSGMLTNR